MFNTAIPHKLHTDRVKINNLFYSTRIPTEGKDVIQKADESADHVVVLCQGSSL